MRTPETVETPPPPAGFTGRIPAEGDAEGQKAAAFAALARQAVSSPLFRTSRAGVLEREPLACDIQDALGDFVRGAAFSMDAPGEAYYDALGALDGTLKLFTGECIAEALALNGVTDPATVSETIRCVVRGGRMFDGEGFARAAPRRLITLTPEEVLALPPEERTQWDEESAQQNEDFYFMMSFVEGLYPHVRRHFKEDRAFRLTGEESAITDVPLYAAFDRLLSLVDAFQADPDFLPRFREDHARNVKAAARINERRSAKKAKIAREREAAHADA